MLGIIIAQLFWARDYHNKAISSYTQSSKVRPQLSFEGKTKNKTVLTPANHYV